MMVYKDEYADWAKEYDMFGKITDINIKEQNFLRKIFDSHNVKVILDCACGTGQHLYMLSKLGYDLRGSDYSLAMLQTCKTNLDKENIDIVLKQADFRYLEKEWNEKYDAVICMTQAIAHMHTQEDIIMALSSMHKRLEDGGLLVMTQGTTHITLQEKYRFDLVVNNRDFTRVFARDISEQFQTINILDIFHNKKENKMEKHSFKIRIILDDDYKSLLIEAGYSKVHIFGDYNMNPYDKKKSMKLIVVAQK